MEIKQAIDSMNEKIAIDEKVKIAKTLLVNTDIIKEENVLCQFDDDKWYSEHNYLKKYLEYKDKKSPIYKEVDCDVSILCVVMYALLDENLNLNNIAIQKNGKWKYELRNGSGRYRGDTLTSAMHLLKLYLGCLWKRIDNSEQLREMEKYKKFYELFDSLAITGKLKTPLSWASDWRTYCYKHSDIIWEVMDGEVKEFFRCYNMFGNYMCIPGNAYMVNERKWTSFNMSRSNKGEWDTVDTLLAKVYAYYKYSDITYLEAIFTDKKEELREETLRWLDELYRMGGWNDFIKKNALQPFVDKNTGIPISLKTGNPIDINAVKTYDAIPKTYEEFLVFFAEVSERIMLRNECIYNKVRQSMR